MKIRNWLSQAAFATGINPVQLANFLRGLPHYYTERRAFKHQLKRGGSESEFEFKNSVSLSGDRFQKAGSVRGHYFNQDLFVAKKVFLSNPIRHVDVGSRLDGFIAHIASFRKIDVLDIRPLESPDTNIIFHQANVLELEEEWFESTDSLPCLHALENFGLGRYGDPIDVDGWKKGLDSLNAMLKPDGVLYLSVPTGLTQRIEFNAQRVFSLESLFESLSSIFAIEDLSVIDRTGKVVPIDFSTRKVSVPDWLTEYDCSIWTLTRR
jgi:hypothetical protein